MYYKLFSGVIVMLDKFFTFLGFNSGKSCIGLKHLLDNVGEIDKKPVTHIKKELKLSDLMRGE